VKYGFDYSENYRSETKVLSGGSSYEYGVAEYNIAEYAGGIQIEKFFLNVSGNGVIIQLGIETEINNNPFSVQRIDVGIKQGKILI
jgi:hypothetical protein